MAAVCAALMPSIVSCKQTDMSNKEERNAIRAGNKAYDKGRFAEAVAEYDDAIRANDLSEAAYYNRAMAQLNLPKPDSTTFRRAQATLDSLGQRAREASISEKSLYNLGNYNVIYGDMLKAASQDPANQAQAQEMSQMSTQAYKQAIEYYKQLLRKRPNNMRAVQNLRIAQLKLPPEEQNQNQQNQQQQQQQQQQPEQQQQQDQARNQDEKQVLQSVQAKENQTRKAQPTDPAQIASDKPW